MDTMNFHVDMQGNYDNMCGESLTLEKKNRFYEKNSFFIEILLKVFGILNNEKRKGRQGILATFRLELKIN